MANPIDPAAASALLLRLATGNWLGAGAVALVPVVVAGVGSALLSLLQQNHRGDLGSDLWGAVAYSFASLGAPLSLESGSAHVTTFSVPLTITFAAYGLAAVVFARITRNYASRAAALGDALRAAILFGAITTFGGILFRIIHPTLKGFGGADGPGQAIGNPLSFVSDQVRVAPAVVGLLFIPGSVLATVLVALVLRRATPADQGLLTRIQAFVAAPLHAVRILLWCTVPAAGVMVLATDTASGASHSLQTLSQQLFGLPNLGVITLGLGLGAPFGSSGTGVPSDAAVRVGSLAHQLDWVIWFAIPVALLVMVIVGAVAARLAPARLALWSTLVYLGTLLVALPLLGLFANNRLSYGGPDGHGHYRSGIGLAQFTFTFWGGSILVCLLALVLMGKLKIAHLQAQPAQLAPQQIPLPPAGNPPFAPPPSTQPQAGPPPAPPWPPQAGTARDESPQSWG